MHFRLVAIIAVVAAFVVPATASASEMIDRNASKMTLKVASNGQALVSYNARGKRWNVLAWGAVNAIAPTPTRKQVEFKLDYSGGWGTYKQRRLEDVQEHLPRLRRADAAWFVAGVQGLRTGATGPSRPGSGCFPTTVSSPTPKQAVWELRLSHWSGPPARADREPELGLQSTTTSSAPSPTSASPSTASVDVGRRAARHLRAQPLRGHVQLGVRRRAGSARTASSCTRAPACSVTASTARRPARRATARATARRSSAPA